MIHLIIKVAKLASVFKAVVDHPLGLLKVKAGNLRGILIVVRVKLQKIPPYQYPLHDRQEILADNFPSYLHNFVAMENRLPWQQRDISKSQLSEGVDTQV